MLTLEQARYFVSAMRECSRIILGFETEERRRLFGLPQLVRNMHEPTLYVRTCILITQCEALRAHFIASPHMAIFMHDGSASREQLDIVHTWAHMVVEFCI